MISSKDDTISLVGSLANQSSFKSLGIRQRSIAFSACLLLGINMQLYAIWNLIKSTIHPLTFTGACLIGIAIHLFGTFLIASPMTQIATVKDRYRLPALMFYTLTLVATVLSGTFFVSPMMVYGILGFQVCAYIWYCFCWSPFAKVFRDRVYSIRNQEL